MMEISRIFNIILIFFAISMLYYLFTFKLKDTNSIINIEEEYTGAAKNPDELSEPNEDALRELERLLGDN
jgi:hypothetical protein